MGICWARPRHTVSICCANSRVGVRINAWLRGVFIRPCKTGNTNAAVLPVPVCAVAIRSRPARMTGIAWAWIGVGSV
jgi:hypothetical protein